MCDSSAVCGERASISRVSAPRSAPASMAAEALTDPVHTLHDLVCPSCCACVVLILLTAKCTYPLAPPTNPAPPCSHC